MCGKMTAKQMLKCILLILLFLVLTFTIVFGISSDDYFRTSLTASSETNICVSKKYAFYDYSDFISANGVKAATDTETSTIYITVSDKDLKNENFFDGLLEIFAYPKVEFVVDVNEYYDKISKGEPLQVFVFQKNSQEYMRYNLVITTLPVISLYGNETGRDKNGNILYNGDFAIWSNNKSEYVKESSVEWGLRGFTSLNYDKKSFKLSLKKHNTDNHMSLLNLGSDYEWILNAMAIDDTKVREKMIMDVWNQLASISDHNAKMSNGEYVELIINGSYKGLYLLQRQVNERYLNLNNETVLLKGNNTWSPTSVYDGYEIKYVAGVSKKEIYKHMSGLFLMNDFSNVNINNWIDINLFVQFGNMYDNTWIKNSFYTISYGDSAKIGIILWDTDMSFGVVWKDTGSICTFEPGGKALRAEYAALISTYPEVKDLMSERWKELRRGVLSNDNFISTIEKCRSEIESTGAICRDNAVNGLFHNGDDDYEKLIVYVLDQFCIMDEIYF